jgi:hypothetical protein
MMALNTIELTLRMGLYKKKKGQVIVKKAPETSKSGTCPLPNTKISHM